MPAVTRRIVFMDGDIPTIMGCVDALGGKFPIVAEGVTVRDRLVPFVSLVKVRRRYALYKEPMVPRSFGSMHPAQR